MGLLKSGLIERGAAMPGSKGFFVQDGASMHLTAATLSLLSGHMQMGAGWPPNSPDVNPIELLGHDRTSIRRPLLH